MAYFGDRNINNIESGDFVSADRTGAFLKSGSPLDGITSHEDFIKASGMDFTVTKQAARDKNGAKIDGVYYVEKRRGVLDEGVAMPKVSVGEIMTLVQHETAMRPLTALVEQGKASFTAAGTFKDGAEAWALASLNKEAVITRLDGKEDPVEFNLLARNAHDGSSNIIWGLSPNRFFCRNQLNGMTKSLQMEVRMKHSSSVKDQIERLAGHYTKLIGQAEKAARVWQKLADKRMNVVEFQAFAREFLATTYNNDPKGEDERAQKARDKREQQVIELTNYFTAGAGNTGESAWDAYNGLSEWVEHRRETYAASKWTAKQWDTHARSQGFGEGRNRRSRALRMLTRG